MKRKISFVIAAMAVNTVVLSQGRVGINTNMPLASLHVKDSSVVFTGDLFPASNAGNPPVSGRGTRMMWYAPKAAFRVGEVLGSNWDASKIGNTSFGAGYNVLASGLDAVAMGDNTTAAGAASVALGNRTEALGTQSMSIGLNTTASGSASFASGSGSRATGAAAACMGIGVVAQSFASLVIGQNNDSIVGSSLSAWQATDPVFMIGNGISFTQRSNAFTVLKNAKTGINTAAPEYGLHVVNDNPQDGGYVEGIMVESITTGANVGEAAVSFKNQSFLSANKKWITGLNQAANFRWDYDAQFGGGAAMVLDTTGDLTIQGSLSQSSDVRLKKDIMPLQNSLQKLLGLTGYHYNWLGTARGNKLQTGLLAQEIEPIMPELVSTDIDGMKSVNYSGLTPYVIEALKEQQQKITRLENELIAIKKLLNVNK